MIAVVLSYLKPEYARQVLTALPVELQAKVAMEALMVRQVTREQLMAIDSEIKESVDFVVGGIERLTQMLEEADAQTRMHILEYLKNERPAVYEHVRKAILIFEDISGFPDREMQAIVRELKTENMARALQGAAPEVINKFFNNMSSGAASLLKESMEYAKDLTLSQIEGERSKILDQIRMMEKEGRISVRGTGQEEGFQEVLATSEERSTRYGSGAKQGVREAAPSDSAKTSVDPAQAQQYLQAGIQFHESGQLEQALPYFQHAVDLDPSLAAAYHYLGTDLYQLGRVPEALAYYEKLLQYQPDPQLQAWVDGFKAQMQSPG
jgi:tetratricopeptide (TPR) repeat protein